jgi:hypothetical protein
VGSAPQRTAFGSEENGSAWNSGWCRRCEAGVTPRDTRRALSWQGDTEVGLSQECVGVGGPKRTRPLQRSSLMKLFILPSQARAVELRAALQMLMRFARLKSS